MRYSKFVIVLAFILGFSSCSPTNAAKRILPRESFLKIKKYLDVTLCHPQKKDLCVIKRFGASASGVIVDSNGDHAYALTAAHVCTESNAKKMLGNHKFTMQFFVVNIHKRYFPVEIVAIDTKNDLCILYIKGLYNPPIFDGFFDGNSGARAIYSLPAKGGSSGSPIVNHRGELIGMVSAVYTYFPQITISPKFKETTAFIKREVNNDKQKRNVNAIISFFGDLFSKKEK